MQSTVASGHGGEGRRSPFATLKARLLQVFAEQVRAQDLVFKDTRIRRIRTWQTEQRRGIDIDIDIFGFIEYTMHGSIRVHLSPPPPQSSIARSGAGVGIAFRVRLPLANSPKYRRSARTPASGQCYFYC